MSKAFWSDLKISFLGGKILFCKEPLAMDVKGSYEKVKVLPSTKKCEGGVVVVLDAICGCKVSQVHVGSSPSAHRMANSLWLQRLSMTEGFFVNTTAVEGCCKVVR